MSKQVEQQPEGKTNPLHIVLLAGALLVPGTMWMLFGWVSLLFPLIVFAHIQKFGWKYTNRHFFPAIIAAVVVGYFLGSLDILLFTLALLPTGYIFAGAAAKRDAPWRAGLKGWLTLCGSLFVFFAILSAGSELSFFETVTTALETGIDEAIDRYSRQEAITAENFLVLERTLLQVKKTAPLILPAIFTSILLVTAWSTLLLGNLILPRMSCRQPWPDYKLWKLPEKLIWGVIFSGMAAALPFRVIQLAGVNILIIGAILYSFQGLAITVYYLDLWRTPKFVRTIIYIMIILQSFGTIFLVALGIADVWFDMRRINIQKNGNNGA